MYQGRKTQLSQRIARFAVEMFILVLACCWFANSRLAVAQDLGVTPSEVLGCGGTRLSDTYRFVQVQKPNDFVSVLNKAGKCGYRLVAMTKRPLGASEYFEQMGLSGVVQYEAGKHYDYDWFEAFSPGDAQTKMNIRGNAGFHFLRVIPFYQGLCKTYETKRATTDQENDTKEIVSRLKGALSFTVAAIYIMERSDISQAGKEYRVALGTWNGAKGLVRDLALELVNSARRGFRPVAMTAYKQLNRYAVSILVEREKESQFNFPVPEYEIVFSESGFEKKVNLLSKAGSRLLFVGEISAYRFALLVKSPPKSRSITYVWADTTRRAAEKDLSGLSDRGARFLFSSPQTLGCDFGESMLVFEDGEKNTDKASGFKIIKLTDDDDAATSSSLNTQEFKAFLERGYAFRGLFFDEGVKAILESKYSQ